MPSGRPPAVFFYISGHGFGHAIRQIAVINALVADAGDRVRVFVRTSAPRWLFDRSADRAIVLLPDAVDTGVVQIDGLELDELASIERAAAFYDDLPRRIETERALLERHDAQVVVADAPPLACAAAAAAGIPAVVCANFTWDWIYQRYAHASPAAPDVIARTGQLYRHAAAGWRLPMHGGFETFTTIVDVPLVARHATATRTPAEVRSALELPSRVKLALVSFGGYGVRDLPLDRLDSAPGWHVVLTTRDPDEAETRRGVTVIDERRIRAQGFRYEDLVPAMDAVVSKPGYGIISDCIAAGTPLLYTSRGNFAEYDVLVRDLPALLRCRYLDATEFRSGRWRDALDDLTAGPAPAERPRTDGAAVVARMIREMTRS